MGTFYSSVVTKRTSKIGKNANLDNFRTTRHRQASLVNTRPEISAGVDILSEVTDETYTNEHIKTMNDIIKHVTKKS